MTLCRIEQIFGQFQIHLFSGKPLLTSDKVDHGSSNPYESLLDNEHKDELLTIIVPRQAVEKGTTEYLTNPLLALLYSPANVYGFRQRVNIKFSGYENDQHELWEIKSVRKFINAVSEEFPYWMYFMDPKEGFLRLILPLCACPLIHVKKGYKFENSSTFPNFFKRYIGEVNKLCNEYGLGDDIINDITMSIIDQYKQIYSPQANENC